MKRAQPDEVLTVAFQLDSLGVDQSLELDHLFESLELGFGNAGHGASNLEPVKEKRGQICLFRWLT